MEENVYDRAAFFRKYGEMLRSKEGLEGAGEWHAFREMLPDFAGKSVLDLGCGYGWHCAYAASRGAARVVGIDSSRRMLEVARAKNASPAVEYRCCGIEAFDYPEQAFDLVVSSLALHYVEDLDAVYRQVYRTLRPGGIFAFSVEHPVFTAAGRQDWAYDAEGRKLHWPVDAYFLEGSREACFLGETVRKQHRTLTHVVRGLLQAGFRLGDLVEPQPSAEMLRRFPEMQEEMRRPMMLLVSAEKRAL